MPVDRLLGIHDFGVYGRGREARRRGVEITAERTELACRLLHEADPREVSAVLHLTC